MRTLGIVTLALVLGATSLPAQAGDTLVQTDGRRVRGVEELSLGMKKISFKRNGKDEEIDADKLLEIQWSEPPESWSLAQGAMRRGEYANAANLFVEAASKDSRAAFKAECSFHAAEAMVRAAAADPGKAGPAVQAAESFLSSHTDHFRTPAATILLGRAQLLSGDADTAVATLTTFEDKALNEDLGFLWDARAKYWKAQALLAKKDFAGARSALNTAVSVIDAVLAGQERPDPSVVELKVLAIVGQGETFIEQDQHSQALNYFRNLRSSSSNDPALQAAGLAGEGEALFLQASPRKDERLLRQAQEALARANVLDPAGGTVTAKALFYSGLVLEALAAIKEEPAYTARARAYYQTVVDHYGDTRWAGRAQGALGG